MLTINAMVRIGPWTLKSVSKGDWTRCERCGTRIREVWSCSVDADSPRLEELGGKSQWLIGSKCGPTLMDVSDSTWKDSTKATRMRFALAVRVREAIALADAQDYALPDLVREREEALHAGQLTERTQKHLSLVVGSHLKKLKER